MNGTLSTGCPLHGGPGDVASMKAVIDWLNGRAPGYDKDGNPVAAPWHNGKAAIIGKSYDGTPANGVAATGVDGLTTSAYDSACYKEVEKPTVDLTQWRVSKGILDSSNRESLLAGAATPVAIGSRYRFAWATFPNDFVSAAGHRIGIILVANYTSLSSVAGATGSTVTLDTRVSKVRLPIVGGYGVAVASGGFAGS